MFIPYFATSATAQSNRCPNTVVALTAHRDQSRSNCRLTQCRRHSLPSTKAAPGTSAQLHAAAILYLHNLARHRLKGYSPNEGPPRLPSRRRPRAIAHGIGEDGDRACRCCAAHTASRVDVGHTTRHVPRPLRERTSRAVGSLRGDERRIHATDTLLARALPALPLCLVEHARELRAGGRVNQKKKCSSLREKQTLVHL